MEGENNSAELEKTRSNVKMFLQGTKLRCIVCVAYSAAEC